MMEKTNHVEGDSGRIASFRRVFHPGFKLWAKILAIYLAIGLSGLAAVPAMAMGSLENKIISAENIKIPTEQDMYSSYFAEAVKHAKSDEKNKEKEAIDDFSKTIKLDSSRAVKDSASLDEATKKIYNQAYAKTAWPAIEESMKEKKGEILSNVVYGEELSISR
jgi:hypothetical protein